MSETTTTETPQRPSLRIRCIELPQVASAVAIGAMIHPLFRSEYGPWSWTLLVVMAIAGCVMPFFLARETDAAQAEAYYVVNDQRVETLKAIKLPDDVLIAVKNMVGFNGTGDDLRTTFYDNIGEERGNEQIEMLYKYLRGQRPPTPPGNDRITIR